MFTKFHIFKNHQTKFAQTQIITSTTSNQPIHQPNLKLSLSNSLNEATKTTVCGVRERVRWRERKIKLAAERTNQVEMHTIYPQKDEANKNVQKQ